MMSALSGGAAMIAGAILAAAAPSQAAEASTGPFPIVELRQYTLYDGQRDVLIDLFERQFIESQEALGMKVIGTFRDLDRPNRFVWLRGFTDMDSRLAGLSGFYGGPLWQARRNEANETIADSDNVLLLRASDASAAFKPQPHRPRLGERRAAHRIVATIYYLKGDPAVAAQRFRSAVVPKLKTAGVPLLAWFTTEPAANNYPRLPVREGEKVLVWFARFSGDSAYQAHKAAIDKAAAALRPDFQREPETLRLEPTARSELR